MPLDLFKTKRPDASLHPQFLNVKNDPKMGPARKMLRDVVADMEDPDGNLVEQFQTHGFDSRTFEIYLQALFAEAGHSINRSYDRPDFLITRDGVTAAVEAVTANPPPQQAYQPYVHMYRNPPTSPGEAARYLRNEVAIKFGSPLYSKLKKKYWELPHVAGLPLIIAIESFHGDASLTISSSTLSNYLFGVHHRHHFDSRGDLVIEADAVAEHHGSKTIRSNFFQLPGAENISAVLFSNVGTISKFNRLGHQGKYRSRKVRMVRVGTCYNHDPNATMAHTFAYEVGNSDFPTEKWRQGSVLIHNPHALRPLPPEWLGAGAEENQSEAGNVVLTWSDPFLPYMSTTYLYEGNTPTASMWKATKIQVDLLEIGQRISQRWL